MTFHKALIECARIKGRLLEFHEESNLGSLKIEKEKNTSGREVRAAGLRSQSLEWTRNNFGKSGKLIEMKENRQSRVLKKQFESWWYQNTIEEPNSYWLALNRMEWLWEGRWAVIVELILN